MVQKQNPVTSGLARRCTIYFRRVPEERSRDDLAPHPPSFELDIVNDQWIKSLKFVAYSPIENYVRRKAQSLLDRYRSVAVSPPPPPPPPHPSPFFTCQATLGSVECVWVTQDRYVSLLPPPNIIPNITNKALGINIHRLQAGDLDTVLLDYVLSGLLDSVPDSVLGSLLDSVLLFDFMAGSRVDRRVDLQDDRQDNYLIDR